VSGLNPTTTVYLFDTSVLIEILKRNQAIEQRRQALDTPVYLNAIVLGELLLGAKKSMKADQSLQDVQLLVSAMTLLALEAATSDIYSEIKRDLQTKGQMIPENDIWIAASAKQYNLTLTTRDAHFSRVDGLLVEQW
jgi:tRNA(fMet)-specific endonuclease VapC